MRVWRSIVCVAWQVGLHFQVLRAPYVVGRGEECLLCDREPCLRKDSQPEESSPEAKNGDGEKNEPLYKLVL